MERLEFPDLCFHTCVLQGTTSRSYQAFPCITNEKSSPSSQREEKIRGLNEGQEPLTQHFPPFEKGRNLLSVRV